MRKMKTPLIQKISMIPRVGILVDTSSSWGRRIIQGISNYVRKHETWQLFIEARGLEEHLRIPKGWQGEGVIARINKAGMGNELRALGIPVVNVSGIQLPIEPFPTVTTAMREAAGMALEHFVERGFEHFAYFSLLGVSYVTEQQNSFMDAVREHGSECQIYAVKPHTGAEPDWNLDLAKLGEWLKSLPKPIGILTWNASGSREILYACHSVGILVPEEVAVLSGSDDDVLCEHVHPPLSAILVAAEQIGYQAAQLLHQLMSGKPAPAEPTLIPPVNVVTRQSTDTLAINDPSLVKAMAFIRSHAGQRIQVSDVARSAGLSRRVLERKFLQFLDRSPASEIRRAHLERARHLLIETDLPIPDVAEACGFGSPEYLAYAFKAESGKTPLDYRKTIRNR